MGQYQEIVKEYLLNNSNEYSKFEKLLNQLNNEKDTKLIDRKNSIGHFTASTFVISEQSNRVLMLHHNILKKYLQPGGHIDESDGNPLIAAERELFEETQITTEKLIYKCADPLNTLMPFNISIHKVPENKFKNEKSHYHYDLQYLFLSRDDIQVTLDEKESSSFEWVEWNEFKNMVDYKKLAKKILKLMS